MVNTAFFFFYSVEEGSCRGGGGVGISEDGMKRLGPQPPPL